MRLRTLLVATSLSLLGAPWIPPPRIASAEAESPALTVRTVAVDIPRNAFASQQATHWCWAASVENAFRASGHGVSQARMVRAIYGDAVDMRSGPTSNLSALLDRPWVDDAGSPFRARVVGLFDAARGRYSLDSRALVLALRSGRPLVLGTTSHAMLLIGAAYRESGGAVSVVEATVFDPWPGVGVRTLRNDEVTPVARGGSLAFVADVVITR